MWSNYEELKHIIAKLSKGQKKSLGNICINQGGMTNRKTAKILMNKELIQRTEKIIPSSLGPLKVFDYEPSCVAVHMAWCEYCSKEIGASK